MVKTHNISEKWIKASILGTIWASSEIVLGSFLHNIRMPFSGNVLTSIGIIILISASYKWKDKGLFWRAGIICALLKTLSPSAVIFGPFIAIISEAFLLELSVRIIGHNITGIVTGAVLAMSWNLFYKVFKMILYYGSNIIDIYTGLMHYLEKQTGLRFDAVWGPLIILLIIQIVFGVVSAIVGIKSGKGGIYNGVEIKPAESSETLFNNNHSGFNYSLKWLFADVVFMVVPLLIVNVICFYLWAGIIVSVAVIWAVRYKRALRQLVRLRLWIYFILITMITAFVFTQLQSESKSITDAIIIGVEMNLRAILLIMGFSVLGTELYNPKVRDYFARSYFKQLPPALQLSLESLPVMISNTPDLKTIVKNPAMFVHHIMAFADFRLKQINERSTLAKKIFIITGERNSGKTRCIKELINKLVDKNITVSGIYSEKIIESGEITGFDIVTISTGKQVRFLRTSGNNSQKRIGSFYIYNEGVVAGTDEFQECTQGVVIVDEIGNLELNEGGWFKQIVDIKERNISCVVLVVRKNVKDKVIEKLEIEPYAVTELTDNNCESLTEIILKESS